MPGISGEIIASVPLILGAIRLARFNVNTEEIPSAYFIGLPTPINAISIGSLVIFIEHVKAMNPEYSQPRLLLPIILGLSFLMVTKIKYAKFPLLNFHSGKVNNFRLYGLSLFVVSFGVSFLFVTLALSFWIYFVHFKEKNGVPRDLKEALYIFTFVCGFTSLAGFLGYC